MKKLKNKRFTLAWSAKVLDWNHDDGFPVISSNFILHKGNHPPTAFSIHILGKIIKNFSDSSVFPIYIIVIFYLDC